MVIIRCFLLLFCCSTSSLYFWCLLVQHQQIFSCLQYYKHNYMRLNSLKKEEEKIFNFHPAAC